MAISTKNNKSIEISEEYCSVTTFVKGFYALEDQTVNHCRDKFIDAGFWAMDEGYALYSKELAGAHYREHRDRYISSNGQEAKYYPRLLDYITKSGPVYVMIFAMTLEKAKEVAPQYGIEVNPEMSFDDNMKLVYKVARAVTKECRAEVMAGHEEGTSITKIQFADPKEDKMTMNVIHCSDGYIAAKHERNIAIDAMNDFDEAVMKNPNIIEDYRRELMPYEFGDNLTK